MTWMIPGWALPVRGAGDVQVQHLVILTMFTKYFMVIHTRCRE